MVPENSGGDDSGDSKAALLNKENLMILINKCRFFLFTISQSLYCKLTVLGSCNQTGAVKETASQATTLLPCRR